MDYKGLVFFQNSSLISLIILLFLPPLLQAKQGGGSSLTSIACSSDSGVAKINEVNLGTGQFIELYFTTSITTSSWDLCYLNSSGSEVCSSATTRTPADATYSNGDFAVFDLPSDNMDKKTGEILLKDSSGNAVDSFTYCNSNSCTNVLWSFNAACTTTFIKHAVGQTDMYRSPDGSGSFDDNKTTTKGCSNDGCGGGGGDTAATDFNCVATGADGITGNLYTKTVGQSFTLDVIALQDASTIETSFASGADHTLSVELVDASSGSCATYASLSPVISQNLTFTGAASGIQTSSSMSSITTYRNVKCRVSDATVSPAVVGCSIDAFAIRPLAFIVSSNMTNTSNTGTPTAKAGENFTLTVIASMGYNGTPLIDNSLLQVHSGATQTGNISGSFSAASPANGIATGSSFTYSEVGSFNFATNGIYDDNFTIIDQIGDCSNDFSNTLVNGKVGCRFGNTLPSDYFGRFTPDHFSFISPSSAITPACVAGAYSYMDETFSISYALEARNASDVLTQNYHYQTIASDNYVKASNIFMSAEFIPPGATTSQDLSSRISMIYDPSLWVNGRYQVDNADALFSRIPTVDGAYDGLDIGLKVIDSDDVKLFAPDMLSSDNTNVDCTPPTCLENKIGSTNIRFGRLNIDNAHGSELVDLSVPLYAQYFNGTNFVSHTDDTCTFINLSNRLSLSNPDTSSGTVQPGNTTMTISSGSSAATLANSTLSSGSAGLSFSAPGAGNTGYIDISSDFSSFPWLLFDWDNDTDHDDSPSGKATFGIFSGNTQQIYFREVY